MRSNGSKCMSFLTIFFIVMLIGMNIIVANAEETFRNLKIVTDTRSVSSPSGPRVESVVQASFELPEPLNVGQILHWEMAVDWMGCYSLVDVEVLNKVGNTAICITLRRGDSRDSGSCFISVFPAGGKPIRSKTMFIQIMSPYKQHRQFRLTRDEECITLSIHEGRSELWKSDPLPLPAATSLMAMRLTALNNKDAGQIFYDNRGRWLRFISVRDKASLMTGRLRAPGIVPVKQVKELNRLAEETWREDIPQRPNWALLPPIKNPYFIVYYGMPRPPDKEDCEVPYQNMESASYDNGFTHNWWLKRGVLPLVHVSGTGFGGRTLEEWTEHYMRFARWGFAGIAIDELQGSDERHPENRLMFDACRLVKKKYPKFFIAIHEGSLTPSCAEALRRGYVNLALLENYTYVYDKPDWAVSLEGIRQRIRIHRAAGVLDKTVWHIGWLEPQPDRYFMKGMSPERLEKEIQLIREWAPEAAGVCFYAWAFTRGKRNKLLPIAGELAYKYFIEPAPSVNIKLRCDKKHLKGKVKIEVEAGQSAYGGEVKRYKIFVDDQLVAKEKEYLWDITKVSPGEHIITGQAISSDWLKGVSQVFVEVKDGNLIVVKSKIANTRRGIRKSIIGETRTDFRESAFEPSRAVAVDEGVCYLGVGKGIHVLDISKLSNQEFFFPEKVAEVSLPEIPQRLRIVDRFLYVADGSDGVFIIDVAAPSSPKIIGHYDTFFAEDVFVIDDILLVADGNGGLQLLDINVPSEPKYVGSYPLSWAWGVFVKDNIAYVAAGEEGLRVIDISKPSQPAEIGFCQTPDWALKVFVKDKIACVADWNAGLRIIDISEPESPKEVSSYQLPWAWDVFMKDNIVYVADENVGLHAVDITNPAEPKKLAVVYNKPEAGDVLGLTMRGNTLFLIDGWTGLEILDISKVENLQGQRILGRYWIESIWNRCEKGVSLTD